MKRLRYLTAISLKHWDYDTFEQLLFQHAVEEMGEVARCLCGKNDEPIQNEAVDVALCVLGLAVLTADDDEEIFEVIERKLDKWQHRLEQK